MQVQCPLLMRLTSENSMKTFIKIIPSHPPPTIIMIINMDTDDDTHLWLEEITNLDAPLLSLAYPDAVVDDTDGDSISLGDDLSGDSSDDEDTLPDLDERYTITHVNLGIVSYIEALIISELGHKHFSRALGVTRPGVYKTLQCQWLNDTLKDASSKYSLMKLLHQQQTSPTTIVHLSCPQTQPNSILTTQTQSPCIIIL